mgnify:CR=1 FL=1
MESTDHKNGPFPEDRGNTIGSGFRIMQHVTDRSMNRESIQVEEKSAHRGKVLIVDDERDIIHVLQEYLSGEGYKTLGCTSGSAVINLIKKYHFDILVIDLMMPETKGIELLRSALKVDPQLIGIIITGNGTIETAVDAMKSGAFDYLLKPFDLKLLPPILARAMQVRALGKAQVKSPSLR